MNEELIADAKTHGASENSVKDSRSVSKVSPTKKRSFEFEFKFELHKNPKVSMG